VKTRALGESHRLVVRAVVLAAESSAYCELTWNTKAQLYTSDFITSNWSLVIRPLSLAIQQGQVSMEKNLVKKLIKLQIKKTA
jgi:hypothetical protein